MYGGRKEKEPWVVRAFPYVLMAWLVVMSLLFGLLIYVLSSGAIH